MADVKISAGADPVTLVATDKVPMARSASTTAYAATMTELAAFANTAYVPNYFTGTPSMDGTAAAGTAAFVSRGDHVHPSDTTRVAKAGDTMAGFLTLNANPTANLHAATKQYVDGSAPVGGPYVAIANMHDVGRNLLHNPLFNVAQRGVGPFTTFNAYTVDRWQLGGVTDTASIRQWPASDADRATIGDEAAAFHLDNAFTGNAAAGAYHEITHRIEDARRLAGKSVTLSFWAVAGVAGIKLGINMLQHMGTGGSPSADVSALATGNAVTLSASWTRYSTTIALPSLSGKVLGTNGDHWTGIRIAYSSGATNNAYFGNIGVQSGNINLWGVQLEIGSVATPLEKPDPRYDLANAQRFYQLHSAMQLAGNAAAAGIASTNSILFPAMRATPTAVLSGQAYFNATAVAVVPVAGAFSTAQTTITPSAAGQYVATFNVGLSADL